MLHRKISVLVILALMTTFSAACGEVEGQPAEAYACTEPAVAMPDDHPRAAQYQDALDEAVADNMPGAMLAIRSVDGALWRGSSGQADLASGVAMDTCHLSRAGSVAKPFTAVLVMMLVEQGVVSLDDHLSDHLPKAVVDGIANAQTATLRQVLAHTSGIPDYARLPAYSTSLFNDPTHALTMEENLDYVRGVSADFAPGTDWSYSNTGYELLGFLVEEMTGKSYETVLTEQVLDPLNLSGTYLPLDGSTPAGTVPGYIDLHGDGEVFDVTDWKMGYTSTAGGLVTTTHDLMVFIEALFAGELISEESLVEMMAPVEVSRGKIRDGVSAHGLTIWETDRGIAYGHRGDVMGYHSEVAHFPETGATYALLINGGFGKILREMHFGFRPELPDLLH